MPIATNTSWARFEGKHCDKIKHSMQQLKKVLQQSGEISATFQKMLLQQSEQIYATSQITYYNIFEIATSGRLVNETPQWLIGATACEWISTGLIVWSSMRWWCDMDEIARVRHVCKDSLMLYHLTSNGLNNEAASRRSPEKSEFHGWWWIWWRWGNEVVQSRRSCGSSMVVVDLRRGEEVRSSEVVEIFFKIVEVGLEQESERMR